MNVDAESESESSDSSVFDYDINQDETVEDPEMDGDELSAPVESTFDLTLPGAHSYLGHNLEEVRGRTILDDGIYMNLPLVVKQAVVLFPGQTLPMTAYDEQTIEMLKTCVQNDRTFGFVCLGSEKMLPIGTTAEIYEYVDDPQEGFRLKAKGRQRFKIMRVIIRGYNTISANVKILPEITLGPPLLEEHLASLNRLRTYRSSDMKEEDIKKQDRIEKVDAMVTPWPAWVYKQYDPAKLSSRIRKHLRFLEDRGSNIPEEPIDLSYWVAQNLPLDENERVDLLNYDCAISRLQKEIKYLIKNGVYVCGNCDSFIERQSQMFPMSTEGPQGTYCNSGGFIYETVTLFTAQGLKLSSVPSTAYTWFPGYAWTIANCKSCSLHMGWKFTAVVDNLQPRSFWGLTRKNLKTKE